jgi:hypothetical protein
MTGGKMAVIAAGHHDDCRPGESLGTQVNLPALYAL